MTTLIEFKNKKGETLRGLYDRAQSDTAVLFLHGFERTTVEYKFKNIVDRLQGKVCLFRFDFSGCGMSDGEFGSITAEKYAEEIDQAIKALKKKVPKVKKIVLVAHSFASCAALVYLSNYKHIVHKIVFMGPAFNQRVLQRMWFAQRDDKSVTFQTYTEHMTEEAFEAFMFQPSHGSKAHIVSKKYFLENKEKDYQELLPLCGVDCKNMLIVHGENDEAVPIESNDTLPLGVKVIRVTEGDHDLQKPAMVKQYLSKVVSFTSFI